MRLVMMAAAGMAACAEPSPALPPPSYSITVVKDAPYAEAAVAVLAEAVGGGSPGTATVRGEDCDCDGVPDVVAGVFDGPDATARENFRAVCRQLGLPVGEGSDR